MRRSKLLEGSGSDGNYGLPANERFRSHDGRDVGVGYNSPTPIAATVFIYPGPKDFALLPAPKLENVSEALLDQHFQVCKQDILRNHSDGKMIAESPCKIVQGKNRIEGKRASFSLSYKFGSFPQKSVSELYVFLIDPSVKFLVTDREFVKYRFTYPILEKAHAESEVAAFLSDLAWPTKSFAQSECSKLLNSPFVVTP